MTYEEMEERFDRENITLAPLNKRVWAYFVDSILLTIIFRIIYGNKLNEVMEFLITYLQSRMIGNIADIEDKIMYMYELMLYWVLINILYHGFFIWMYGATVGKILFKIKVINPLDFSNPNLLQSVLRAFVRIFSEGFFYLGFIWAYMTPKRETWHDLAAKTLVVNA